MARGENGRRRAGRERFRLAKPEPCKRDPGDREKGEEDRAPAAEPLGPPARAPEPLPERG